MSKLNHEIAKKRSEMSDLKVKGDIVNSEHFKGSLLLKSGTLHATASRISSGTQHLSTVGTIYIYMINLYTCREVFATSEHFFN